eukprot:2059660-Amphidinium_carterae.1
MMPSLMCSRHPGCQMQHHVGTPNFKEGCTGLEHTGRRSSIIWMGRFIAMMYDDCLCLLVEGNGLLLVMGETIYREVAAILHSTAAVQGNSPIVDVQTADSSPIVLPSLGARVV